MKRLLSVSSQRCQLRGRCTTYNRVFSVSQPAKTTLLEKTTKASASHPGLILLKKRGLKFRSSYHGDGKKNVGDGEQHSRSPAE